MDSLSSNWSNFYKIDELGKLTWQNKKNYIDKLILQILKITTKRLEWQPNENQKIHIHTGDLSWYFEVNNGNWNFQILFPIFKNTLWL